MGRNLVEISPIEVLETHVFNESEADGKKYLMRVKSVSQHADKRNANGRIYPESILQREVNRIREEIKKNPGSVLEQGDHPLDGMAKIRGVAAMLEDISYDPETKRVITTSKIFKTEVGRDLAAILEGGGRVGRSSRGFGTVKQGEVVGESGDVVQDDYQLKAIDFVIGQSTQDAYVTQFLEHALDMGGRGDTMEIKNLTIDDLRSARPDLITQIETTARTAAEAAANAAIDTRLASKVEEKTREIETRLTKEMTEALKKPDGTSQADWDKMNLGQKMKACKDAADEADTNEQAVFERMTKIGSKVGLMPVKKDGGQHGEDHKKVAKVEQDLATTRQSLVETQAALVEVQNTAKELKEQAQLIEVDKYIMEKTKGEKRFRNALIEGLRGLGCKTREEVDAKLPVERQRIERLLEETGGGKGDPGNNEEIESSRNGQKIKVKVADGKIMELTESEIRQRKAARLPTELVEA